MEKKEKRKIEWNHLFLFTKEGRIKSTNLLYAFFIGVVMVFVDFFISNRLTILLESSLAQHSRMVKNIAGTVLSALLCMLIAAMLFHFMKRKRVVLAAYWIAWLIVTIFLGAIRYSYDQETLEVLFLPFVCIFEVPAAANAFLVTGLFCRWYRRLPVPDEKGKRERP